MFQGSFPPHDDAILFDVIHPITITLLYILFLRPAINGDLENLILYEVKSNIHYTRV